MERPRFSEELSTRRRQLGYSTIQASRVLRLKEEVIIAFEEGNFEMMPKSGYAQGMLSSYARYLGLDAASIVEMYLDELEEWRREMSRSSRNREPRHEHEIRSAGVGQPYVASRGLLPTSGGPAGDMGSFATTRVRVRGSDSSPRENRTYDHYGSTHSYQPPERSRTRPYTGRSPERRSHRDSGSQSPRRDIQTRDYGVEGFEDDLRIGMEAQSYKSASSRSGRRPSRGTSGHSSRQRVRPRSGNRNRSSRPRNRSTSRRHEQNTSRQTIVIIVVAIVVISVILVNFISSCYNRNFNTNTSQHPVSAASVSDESSSSNTSSTQTHADENSSSSSSTRSGTSSTRDSSSGQSSEKSNKSTSKTMRLSVSVADGAVTWLEVECDGTSEIARQVTGPWSHTYDVEESFTVQANDSPAVTVEQDGKQLQFELMPSGVGVISVQGEKKPSATSNASEAAKNKKSSDSDEEDTETSDDDSSSSSPAARTGNDSATNTSTSKRRSSSTSSVQDDDYDETEN